MITSSQLQAHIDSLRKQMRIVRKIESNLQRAKRLQNFGRYPIEISVSGVGTILKGPLSEEMTNHLKHTLELASRNQYQSLLSELYNVRDNDRVYLCDSECGKGSQGQGVDGREGETGGEKQDTTVQGDRG